MMQHLKKKHRLILNPRGMLGNVALYLLAIGAVVGGVSLLISMSSESDSGAEWTWGFIAIGGMGVFAIVKSKYFFLSNFFRFMEHVYGLKAL